ncbi:hypothetical protein CROQUDRAFT_164856 [Cronartium quercuum f. sp. fusiforme G11]|uniref:Uncharacterized protein n=1 Tax=Cronartium quercuum f. sp. fusiforme G11 TaxID=708437 RepID=A0A9P6T9R2_9BASI|nr:hypothetical protein CROQUDRAFT_164856 [Cronartium quercuum f. sp. fusiforme G11]
MLADPMGSSSQLGPSTTNHFDLSSISFSDSYTTIENASNKVLLPSRTTVPYRSLNMNCESLSTSRDVPFWEGQSSMDANFSAAHISTVELECSPLAPSAIWNQVQRGPNSIHLDDEDSYATEENEKEVFARDNSEIKGTSRMVSGRRYREYP